MIQIGLFIARLTQLWGAFQSVWRHPIGKGVLATLAALALVWLYGEWKAGDAVTEDRAAQSAAQASRDAATRERIKDATNARGGADAARDRLRSRGPF